MSGVYTDEECQIENCASCNVISHSLVCKLLQDGNPKVQEIKLKLQMYDGSGMIPFGITDIKCEVNQVKYTLQFQMVDTKKHPLILTSASLTLILATLNLSNG